MEIQDHRCPNCFTICDAVKGVTGKRGPKSGDFTICYYCSFINIFNEDFSLRAATNQEINELDEETKDQLLKISSAIKDLNFKPQLR